MISAIFDKIVFEPLYNGLIYIVGVVPGHDVGIAVITLTVLVRIIIYPLSQRAIKSQQALKKISPLVEELKKKYPSNSPEQTLAVMALYKEHNIHPFAGLGLLIIQLPILIGLYLVFAHGGLPAVDTTRLYGFVGAPTTVDMWFLGIINMGSSHNIVLTLLTVVTQFAYTRLSLGPVKEHVAESSFSGDLARSFDTQARYILPIIIGIFAYSIVAAAPLYWITSNVCMITQEYIGGRRFRFGEK
ncbi:YidC/Oxa1 family membrane protein insertase [Candidatus Kaiserbacteria bacterium]|nr:YidC/Oxa1 family membrane protein insertase [Candidatus Kaiserbacteria bacterium]